MSNVLPNNWHETELGDIAKWGAGGTPSRKNKGYYDGEIPWVKTGDLGDRWLNSTSEYITVEGLNNSSAKIFPKNSIAIAMYGATIGKTSILGIDAATNQACAVAIPHEEIDRDFLYYLLNNEKENFIQKGKGGAQPNISQAIIKDHAIWLPPLNEQTRIANKLDSLLAKVDAAQARLDKIPTLLKRFRQSVLAAATSGELTREWRDENSKSLSDWKDIELGNIAQVQTGSTPLKKEHSYYHNGTIPWLTSAVTGEKLVTRAETYVSEKAVTECRLKIFRPGTLLMAMYGEGKTRGQVTEIAISATINQACAAITINDDSAIVSFIKLCLDSNYAKTRRLAEGGNQPNLNLSKVRGIEISLPEDKEQQEIVRRVESLFTLADTVEKQHQDAKQRIDRLTQSILAKAFRGELVPQDPNDEPASELLKRIQAERAAQKPVKKTRKKKTKASEQTELPV